MNQGKGPQAIKTVEAQQAIQGKGPQATVGQEKNDPPMNQGKGPQVQEKEEEVENEPPMINPSFDRVRYSRRVLSILRYRIPETEPQKSPR